MTPRIARWSVAAALLGLCLVTSIVRAGDPACRFDAITEWNPTGWVGCTAYGEGTASTWSGPGVARPDCLFPWTDCQPIAIQSLDTGVTIITTPTMFCGCWVNGVGPNGETERLVDLDPSSVAALGLPGPGLYSVKVWAVREGLGVPVGIPSELPDTAAAIELTFYTGVTEDESVDAIESRSPGRRTHPTFGRGFALQLEDESR